MPDAPDPQNPANQHEFFGRPCCRARRTAISDDAVRIANATDYGLSGGIYTADLDLGLRLVRTASAPATVQINTGLAAGFTLMGGFRQSGYAACAGAAGIRAFQELQHGGGKSMSQQGEPWYTKPDLTLVGEEHVRRYLETDGAVGHEWNGVQTLVLTTTGRRSASHGARR